VPALLFEIWEDRENHSFEMSRVTERSDELRRSIAPNSVRVHSFFAGSDFKAFQLSYDWHGWGTWKPEPDWPERHFTDEEALEQQRYLDVRSKP
jgi:hypothetical protein